jgi:hypothetical protein
MSEPESSTGYRESPDTTDGPANTGMADDVPGEARPVGDEQDAVTLTTDEDAQRDEGTVRPGNVPD